MYFIYKNRSSEEFGLKITDINNLSSPKRSIEVVSVTGRDGDLIIDNGNFENFELKITCDIKSELVNKHIVEVAYDLKHWLQSEFSYGKLIISDDAYVHYEAVCINELDISRIAMNFGEVLLKFTCKPYKKVYGGDEKIIITHADKVINDYMSSRPLIKVIGNGDITININSQSIVLKGIQDEIEIDSEMYNAYKIDKFTKLIVNENNKMYSDFPILEEGINNITWTGNVLQLEITPRWAVL